MLEASEDISFHLSLIVHGILVDGCRICSPNHKKGFSLLCSHVSFRRPIEIEHELFDIIFPIDSLEMDRIV